MKEIYDESGTLIGYKVAPDQCICKECNKPIFSMECLHSGEYYIKECCAGLGSSEGPWCDECAEQLG